MDKALNLLGLARKAGRLELGEEPVGGVCRDHRARLILLAADAADNTLRRAEHFAQMGNAPWVQGPYTKTQLGWAVGRDVCAMLAFTDAGLAAAFAKKLAEDRPEAYAEAAAQVDEKAQRLARRRNKKKP